MPRITLVLGAGGPVGHAFHAGALLALSDTLGWDPRRAKLVVGTSAGAQVAALLRAGMSAEDLSARVTGRSLSPEGSAIASHYSRPSHARGGHAGAAEDGPRGATRGAWRPSSSAYLRRCARRPWSARPGPLVSALLPLGDVCLLSQAEGLRRLFGDEWSDEALWITAVCLHSGERVAFGRADAPRTDVGTAVAGSGAVPGLCAPVGVGGRLFVDGGVASATHLDLVSATDDELVVVSSPLSVFLPMRLLLRAELWRLRGPRRRVLVCEPNRAAAAVMGLNPMDLARAPSVAAAAYDSVCRQLARRSETALLSQVL